MKLKFNFSLDNPIFFRYLFFIFLVVTPILTSWVPEFNSLYVLTVIFLGFGFWNKSKWFLFLTSSFGVIIRTLIISEDGHPIAFFLRWFVYLTVVFISSEVTKQYFEIKKNKNELIMALAKSLDSRDTYTGNHSENVANYALMIAKEMNLSKKQCHDIYIGGLLHDFGKIGIPEFILTKSTKLASHEYEIIKQHPILGFETMKHITSFRKRGILDMVLYHHERYDGTGYPYGLKGEEIPLAARIISLADAFDAMVSKRHYKKEMGLDYAINEIINNKGMQFDPEIADFFVSLLKREGTEIIFTRNMIPIKIV